MGIDNVIFNTIVIIGETNSDDLFYDINLEVDQILPHNTPFDSTASEIKKSTSNNRILFPAAEVNKESRKISPEEDEAYLNAVNSGDMETTQRMVEEAGIRYSKNLSAAERSHYPSDSIDRYTEKEYNDRGWAVVNHVLNGTELKQMYSAIAEAKKSKTHSYRYTPSGELIISTGRKPETLEHIVFVSGTYNKPVITRIYEYIGTEKISEYKGNLFEEVAIYEELGLTDALEIIGRNAGNEYFTAFTRGDFETYSEKRRSRFRTGGNIGKGSANTGDGSNKRGSSAEDTEPVKYSRKLQTTQDRLEAMGIKNEELTEALRETKKLLRSVQGKLKRAELNMTVTNGLIFSHF